MRRSVVFKFLALACCLSLLVLPSCSKKLTRQEEGGAFYDKKEDIKYYLASPAYEPIAMGEEVYAKAGKTEFFEIVGASPEEWLCQTYGGVYYAEGVALPDIDEMNIDHIRVMDDTSLVSFVKDGDVIDDIIGVYLGGQTVEFYNYTPKINWTLKFADEELGLYYVINYIEYAEDYIEIADGVEMNRGRKFIYDVYNDVFTPAGDWFDETVKSYYAE